MADREPSRTFGRDQRATTTALAVGFALVYGLTAEWSLKANVDVIATALPAWSLVTKGTIILDAFAGLNPWLVESSYGIVSNRPPGLVLVAVPGYLLARPEGFTNAPATAMAIIATIGFLAVLHRLLLKVVDHRAAVIAVVTVGLGTATWNISSNQLWPHGPGQLLAIAALMAAASGRYLGTGAAMAVSLLVRPVTAVAAAVFGLLESLRTRRWGPALAVGVPTILALGGLLAYNRFLFGEWSIASGYAETFIDRLVSTADTPYLVNLGRMFFSGTHGLFVWSPVVLVAAVGMVATWKSIPPWARSGTVAAVVYLLVHARLNRASAGAAFGYRYPLEALALSAPALTIGARWLANRSSLMRSLLVASILVSVAIQLALVFFQTCVPGPEFTVCSFVNGTTR